MNSKQLSFCDRLPYEGMPTTRYQGSKRKLLPELHEVLSQIPFSTCLDAFGGTGSVTHLLRFMGKEVQFNDILQANCYSASALFSNNECQTTPDFMSELFKKKPKKKYLSIIEEHYEDVYFTNAENCQLDILVQNIQEIECKETKAEVYHCLFQAAISKRPYNLFHRANLHMRTKDVERSFGNKVTWERPFIDHMQKFLKELVSYKSVKSKSAVSVTNQSAFQIQQKFDLVYIDTPYAKSEKKQESNYFNFYHFLDALVMYDGIKEKSFSEYAHKPIYHPGKSWFSQENITAAFDNLFLNFKGSKLAISYRDDGFPSVPSLVGLLQNRYSSVEVHNLSEYKYVLSKKKNKNTQEIVIVAQ